KKIAEVAGSSLPNAQWEFVVFESKEANAFCLPGGKIGVYTGILPITQDEAGLATVISHEVAHAVAHHGAERMSEAKAMALGGQAVSALSANAQPITQSGFGLAYGIVAKVGRELPHSRLQETEADHIGLKFMTRAGYDPESAVDFWKRFSAFNEKAGGSGTPAFLRTHPVDSKRIADLQKWIPEVKKEVGGK
ncbi:MAG: M48 family metallopeptidase, partial [Verrucomicrobiota bacterium]